MIPPIRGPLPHHRVTPKHHLLPDGFNPFANAESPQELFQQLAGAASTCWSNPAGAGVFESELAKQLCDLAMERLIELAW